MKTLLTVVFLSLACAVSAAVALPPTTNAPDVAALMLHQSQQYAGGNAAMLSGQVAELQHRIDRLGVQMLLLGFALVVAILWIWQLRTSIAELKNHPVSELFPHPGYPPVHPPVG